MENVFIVIYVVVGILYGISIYVNIRLRENELGSIDSTILLLTISAVIVYLWPLYLTGYLASKVGNLIIKLLGR